MSRYSRTTRSTRKPMLSRSTPWPAAADSSRASGTPEASTSTRSSRKKGSESTSSMRSRPAWWPPGARGRRNARSGGRVARRRGPREFTKEDLSPTSEGRTSSVTFAGARAWCRREANMERGDRLPADVVIAVVVGGLAGLTAAALRGARRAGGHAVRARGHARRPGGDARARRFRHESRAARALSRRRRGARARRARPAARGRHASVGLGVARRGAAHAADGRGLLAHHRPLVVRRQAARRAPPGPPRAHRHRRARRRRRSPTGSTAEAPEPDLRGVPRQRRARVDLLRRLRAAVGRRRHRAA